MFIKKLLLAVMLVVLSLPLLSMAQDTEEVETVLFIGTVTDLPDEFVGLAIDGENVTFYICDGQPENGTISIAQWFVGTAAESAIDITAANGNRVEITLDDEAATGKLTFKDGTVKEFVMHLAEGEAALYRSDFAFGDEEYVLGWLVLDDGTVRGG
jgi:hypothetical protein